MQAWGWEKLLIETFESVVLGPDISGWVKAKGIDDLKRTLKTIYTNKLRIFLGAGIITNYFK